MMVRTGGRDHGVRLGIAQLVRPGVRQLLIDDRIGTTQVSSRVEMHKDFYDTIATVDGLEILNHFLIGVVILTVVADRSTVRTSVHVAVNGVFRCRPDGSLQGEDRINDSLSGSGFPNGIYVRAATPDFHTTPRNRVALTS